MFAPGYIQPHGILLVLQEPHLKIVQASENVKQFFGLAAADLLEQSLQRLFSRPQVKRIAAFLLQDNLECCNPFELTARANRRLPLGTSLGKPDRLQAEAEIKQLALTDELTALYNRRGFFLLAEQQLKIAQRTQTPCCLLFADLQPFSFVLTTPDTLHLVRRGLDREARPNCS